MCWYCVDWECRKIFSIKQWLRHYITQRYKHNLYNEDHCFVLLKKINFFKLFFQKISLLLFFFVTQCYYWSTSTKSLVWTTKQNSSETYLFRKNKNNNFKTKIKTTLIFHQQNIKITFESWFSINIIENKNSYPILTMLMHT